MSHFLFFKIDQKLVKRRWKAIWCGENLQFVSKDKLNKLSTQKAQKSIDNKIKSEMKIADANFIDRT